MTELLKRDNLDEAIANLDKEIKTDPFDQIISAFKHSILFQDLMTRNNGLVREQSTGQTYDLNKDEDILRYVTREIHNTESFYD